MCGCGKILILNKSINQCLSGNCKKSKFGSGVTMSIYKSQAGKEKSIALYDKQLSKLNMPFSDIYIKTSFGKTHLVEIGNKIGKPFLMFHGGKLQLPIIY